jgi:hypothetical protein
VVTGVEEETEPEDPAEPVATGVEEETTPEAKVESVADNNAHFVAALHPAKETTPEAKVYMHPGRRQPMCLSVATSTRPSSPLIQLQPCSLPLVLVGFNPTMDYGRTKWYVFTRVPDTHLQWLGLWHCPWGYVAAHLPGDLEELKGKGWDLKGLPSREQALEHWMYWCRSL